jgi:hypothetical protein
MPLPLLGILAAGACKAATVKVATTTVAAKCAAGGAAATKAAAAHHGHHIHGASRVIREFARDNDRRKER